MKRRLGFAVLVLLGLTAFAPAPLPRSSRRGSSAEITLASFQGTWRITEMAYYSSGQRSVADWGMSHVRVSGGRWDFLSNGALTGSSRQLRIDATKKPARLYFDEPDRKGFGLIRRQGAGVQVVYVWGSDDARATSFEVVPDGHWLITLQRE